MSEPSVLDPVTLLGMELCATRCTATGAEFVGVLAKFTEAVVREAFEHQDEVRALLHMPRVNAGPSLPDDEARAGAGGTSVDDDSRETSSTGASGADSSADHQQRRAASDASDAPSTNTPASEQVSPGVALPSAASTAVTNRDKDAPGPGSPLTLAEPAPSQAEGAGRTALSGDSAGASPAGPGPGAEASQPSDPTALPTDAELAELPPDLRAQLSGGGKLTPEQRVALRQQCLDARRANNGALPDGWTKARAAELGVTYSMVYSTCYRELRALLDPQPSAQPTKQDDGPPRALSKEQCADLCGEYLAARAANGGDTPSGWVREKAHELGTTLSAIYAAIQPAQIELMTDRVAPRTTHAPEKAPEKAPESRRHQHTAPPDAEPELVHTETPACWCRKKPQSRDNAWCKLRRDKPASEHPALRKDPPRAERFKVRTMQGTRY